MKEGNHARNHNRNHSGINEDTDDRFGLLLENSSPVPSISCSTANRPASRAYESRSYVVSRADAIFQQVSIYGT